MTNMTKNAAAVILKEAKKMITKHGWVQGKFGTRFVGFCALGAIKYVSPYDSDHGAANFLWDALPCRARTNDVRALANYNDAKRRRKIDILKLFDRAIKLAEKDS